MEAVASATGLKMEDLAPRSQATPGRPSREPEAVYTYQDADGAELFEVCRLPGKQFRQRRRHGDAFAWGLSAGLYRSRNGGPDLYQLKAGESEAGAVKLPAARRELYRLPQVLEAARAGGTVFICEGEKDADAGAALGLVTTTAPQGAGKWQEGYTESLRGAQVVVVPDNDTPGRRHAEAVAEDLRSAGVSVRVLEPLGAGKGYDLSDWISDREREGLGRAELRAELLAKVDAMAEPEEELKPRLRAMDWRELVDREFPPRELILAPWLREKTLAMIYGWRGTGKTWVSLSIAHAVASGTEFLGWQASKPRGVLVVDGEMAIQDLQQRLQGIIAGSLVEPSAPLRLVAADWQETGMPNLCTRDGQCQIEEHLDGVELVLLDNLSTLFHGGKENEAESWEAAQQWILSLRRRGLAVVFMHHAGKNGQQRGTSRREDVVDIVIALEKPLDHEASQGARFQIKFDKARGLCGADVETVEARLEINEDGAASWCQGKVTTTASQRAVELSRQGMKQADIARELGISPSTVSRAVKSSTGAAS